MSIPGVPAEVEAEQIKSVIIHSINSFILHIINEQKKKINKIALYFSV